MTDTAVYIFIGLIAGPLLGGLVSGLDRILTARLQSRIGPPLWQPFYDVVKLWGKEKTVVNVWQAFCAYCYVAATSIALVLFFLKSDLLLILFTQAVGAVFLGSARFLPPHPSARWGRTASFCRFCPMNRYWFLSPSEFILKPAASKLQDSTPGTSRC